MAVTVFNTLSTFYAVSMGNAGDEHSIVNGAGTNVINSTAFDYFSDSPSVNQTLIFRTNKKFCGIKFNVGTAMNGTPDIVWEHYNSGGGWTALKVTNKNAIQFTGVQTVTFTPPAAWLGPTNNRPYYWIRMRLNTVTGITEGGANQTDRVKPVDFGFAVTGITLNALSNIQTLNNATAYEILIATTSATGLIPIEMPHFAIGADDYIDVILAGTTAGAGDTVLVTGTDINGTAISETLDVSAGNGTYTTIHRFKNVTQIDCNGFTDGTIQVKTKTLGLVKSLGTSAFFGCYLTFGDGSTTTTYSITTSNYIFSQDYYFWNRVASTLTLGTRTTGGLVNGLSAYAGIIFTEPTPNTFNSQKILSEGTLRLYGSFIQATPKGDPIPWKISGTLIMYESKIGLGGLLLSATPTLDGAEFLGINGAFGFPATSTGLKADTIISMVNSRDSFIATNLQIEGFNNYNCIMPTKKIEIINSLLTSANISATGTNTLAGDGTYMEKTFDLTVQDTNGIAITGANVTIVNALGTTVATLTTDVNGAITQQKLVREKGIWVYPGSGITWAYHTPHIVTITKAGYRTSVLIYNMTKARDEQETLIIMAGSVKISWETSTAGNLKGYNVYRATISGGPYTKLNGSIIQGTTSYNDTPGTGTWYYVVTSVDISNNESQTSAEIELTIA